MQGRIRMSIVLGAVVVGASGCAGTHQARYVYQDGQFGVVGIPRNTEHWPTHYRKQAEELMARHFPEGYEIVRAEEVVEGSRVLTTNGSGGVEVGAALPLPVLKIGTIGLTSSRNQADSVKIKECRILYKKAEPGGAPKGGSIRRTGIVDPHDLRRPERARPQAGRGQGVEGPRRSGDRPRAGQGRIPGPSREPPRRRASRTRSPTDRHRAGPGACFAGACGRKMTADDRPRAREARGVPHLGSKRECDHGDHHRAPARDAPQLADEDADRRQVAGQRQRQDVRRRSTRPPRRSSPRSPRGTPPTSTWRSRPRARRSTPAPGARPTPATAAG